MQLAASCSCIHFSDVITKGALLEFNNVSLSYYRHPLECYRCTQWPTGSFDLAFCRALSDVGGAPKYCTGMSHVYHCPCIIVNC